MVTHPRLRLLCLLLLSHRVLALFLDEVDGLLTEAILLKYLDEVFHFYLRRCTVVTVLVEGISGRSGCAAAFGR